MIESDIEFSKIPYFPFVIFISSNEFSIILKNTILFESIILGKLIAFFVANECLIISKVLTSDPIG